MNDFLELLHKNKNRVNLFIESYLKTLKHQKSSLIQAMYYSSLNTGGKRIRPFLIYQVGKMLKLNESILDIPASAIELIHTYSLIHDDLPSMDDDNFRRNYPTCHIKYGEGIAILAGNALQALAFNIISSAFLPKVSSLNQLKMIKILSAATGAKGMCYGQTLDLSLDDDNSNYSVKYLENIYFYKTTMLFKSAVQMVILMSNIKNNFCIIKHLYKYIHNIGLAFQIQDDISDINNDQKTIDNNFIKKTNKITYPTLIGLKLSKKKVVQLYNNALFSLKIIDSLGYDTLQLKNLAKYISHRDK